MLQPLPFPIRNECPPGACTCGRSELLADPQADLRVLKLTREEEKRLVARIEAIGSYPDLQKIQAKLHELLGITLRIAPGPNEVKTVRGFQIQLDEQTGLCRKTHQALPAAVRRCLDSHPEIAYAILDAHDLFGAPPHQP